MDFCNLKFLLKPVRAHKSYTLKNITNTYKNRRKTLILLILEKKIYKPIVICTDIKDKICQFFTNITKYLQQKKKKNINLIYVHTINLQIYKLGIKIIEENNQ